MSTMISVAELNSEMACGRSLQVVDVRTASEYGCGHIPCAVNIPMEQFEARRKDLKLEQGVVLVCKGGIRAQIVAGWLKEDTDVRVLAGGTDAWSGEGFEVVTSAKTRWSLERQVRLMAGMLVLAGTALAISGVHGAIWLALFVGAGLTFAGATDICMMGLVLGKMSWNRARAGIDGEAQKPCCR